MGALGDLGIPQLDQLLSPIPARSCLLFAHDPGVEAEAFLYQVAHARLDAGGSVVYVVTNRAPSSVLDAMREFGFDPSDHASRLFFVDAFSALMGTAEDVAYTVRDPKDLRDVTRALERAGKEHSDALLVLDGLSTLVDNATVEGFAPLFPDLLVAIRRFGLSTSLFTRWPYPDEVPRLLEDFDAIITVKGMDDRVTYGQFFALERSAWLKKPDQRPRLFKAVKPGGIFVYIPKVVITGPHNAGKSNFIHSVSDSAVSVDRLGTTVALDHGRVLMHGMAADLFGTPGQERFDSALKVISSQALGVIILVDSTKPESFPRARQMMEKTWRQGLPALVAANKQDLPNALSPDEVAALLEAPPGVKVVGCVASDRASTRKVLGMLLEQVTGGPTA